MSENTKKIVTNVINFVILIANGLLAMIQTGG